jgi:hypothetical protein
VSAPRSSRRKLRLLFERRLVTLFVSGVDLSSAHSAQDVIPTRFCADAAPVSSSGVEVPRLCHELMILNCEGPPTSPLAPTVGR